MDARRNRARSFASSPSVGERFDWSRDAVVRQIGYARAQLAQLKRTTTKGAGFNVNEDFQSRNHRINTNDALHVPKTEVHG